MNNLSLSFPEFKLPQVHVADMSYLSLYEKSSYIPVLSTIKGAADVLAGCVGLVASVAFAVFTAIVVIPINVIRDINEGYQPFGPFIWNSEGFKPYSTSSAYYLLGGCSLLAAGSCIQIGRGIIEAIPVLGNLAIGCLDGRIRIINT